MRKRVWRIENSVIFNKQDIAQLYREIDELRRVYEKLEARIKFLEDVYESRFKTRKTDCD